MIQGLIIATLMLGLGLGSGSVHADDFYKRKTIRVVVGFSAGGGYDTYARMITRHMAKHIPGNPSIVVDNMTGAGSLIAANYTYNKASRNGLTLGVWNSAFVLSQALGDKKVRIKADKLGWIGAPVKGIPACGVMGFAPAKTPQEVLDSKNPIKMGGTRSGSTGVDLPKVLNTTIGTNFDVISGYPGTAKIRLAMQSKEIEGSCFGWESMRVTAQQMLQAKGDGQLIPVLIHRKFHDPEVVNALVIPDVIEKRGGKEKLAVYNAWVGQYEFQRPFVAPPGVPKDRLDVLRRAFSKTLEDPEFLAEAEKSKLLIEYVAPGEIETHVESILGMPAKAKESLQFLVRKQKE